LGGVFALCRVIWSKIKKKWTFCDPKEYHTAQEEVALEYHRKWGKNGVKIRQHTALLNKGGSRSVQKGKSAHNPREEKSRGSARREAGNEREGWGGLE